jgi:hypothetical protein
VTGRVPREWQNDALIAACARKARVATLLTWDIEGFERFLEDEPAVRTPEPKK